MQAMSTAEALEAKGRAEDLEGAPELFALLTREIDNVALSLQQFIDRPDNPGAEE
jgi:hypothetical protein